jgi:hypothetical protein
MAVGITGIHKKRIIKQVEDNLIGLQRDMNNNARMHKAMAQAQAPEVAVLAKFISDCASEYLRRLQWVIELRNDTEKRARLLTMLASAGWSEQDIIDTVRELRLAAIALRDAPKTGYAEIIAACDALLTAVEPPDSLWPE